MRGSLPSGWVVRKLGEVLSQVERPVRVDQNATYRMLGVRLYGNGGYVRETLAGRQMKASQLFRIEQGDFVYTRLFASKGTFALIGEALDGCHASSEFPCFQINVALVEPQYLRCYFMQPWVWRAIEGQSSGTTSGSRLRFNEKDLLRMRVPFPPLPEQRAIAEALQSVDEVIDRSRAVIEQLGQVKKALVQELLTRGLPGRHTRFKPTPVGEIPAEWEVRSLGDVADVRPGIAMGPDRAPLAHSHPYLRVANVQAGNLDLSEVKTMEATAEEARSRCVAVGDVLLVEGHAHIEQLGRAAVVPPEAAGMLHQNHVFCVRVDLSHCLPDLVAHFANGPRGRAYFRFFGGTTSGLNTVSGQNVKGMQRPIPPLAEQEAIGRLVSSVDAQAGAERMALDAAQALKTGLMQDLLTGRRRWKGSGRDDN